MGFASLMYNSVFRRTSTMAVAVLAAAMFYERGCDVAVDYIYDNLNKGKQWKDIKHLYGGGE